MKELTTKGTKDTTGKELKTLPEGWVWTTLQEAAKINGRDPEIRDLPDDLPVTFVPMAAVDATSGTIANPVVRPLKEVRKGFTPFSDGDVIIAKITPCMENGKAAIARNLVNGRGFGSTEFHVFRPKVELLPEFLFHFIRQESFRKDAKAQFAGTAGQLRVPASFLYDYQMPLPPLPEQERIVDRLEELLSDLEAGVAALERVRAGVKRYKASVLKATFEARPEHEWRRLGDVTRVLRGASPRPKGNPKYFGGTIPWIKISDVTREEGKFLTTTVDTVTPEGVKKSRYLSRGSLILSICATVCVPKILGVDGCIHDGFVYFPDLSEGVDTSYLYFFFESIRSKVIQENRQGMTQVNLNTGIVSNFHVPLPPLPDQERIVAEVERRLESVRVVEAAVEAGLKRAARLRQSVLKKAFEGKLS